ncbi:hypothetical protein FHG87_018427 [Trinorchestia longiramus]|nr:hypothetical protein FHG87_018427 [Trinorchestia longiramus]
MNLQIGEYVLKIEDEITSVEIETFFKKLKNWKASGPDDIPYEFYKHSGESIIEMLRCLCDEIWRSERVPDEWNKCNVVSLHKGGHKNMNELKNYRPIALADTVSKIFCGILNERMKRVVEEQGVMGEEQNGFRRDRRGEDNLFVKCGENKWNARCVEEDSGMRYLVGLDEECNMTVVDAMKDFLVHAWNKRQGC